MSDQGASRQKLATKLFALRDELSVAERERDKALTSNKNSGHALADLSDIRICRTSRMIEKVEQQLAAEPVTFSNVSGPSLTDVDEVSFLYPSSFASKLVGKKKATREVVESGRPATAGHRPTAFDRLSKRKLPRRSVDEGFRYVSDQSYQQDAEASSSISLPNESRLSSDSRRAEVEKQRVQQVLEGALRKESMLQEFPEGYPPEKPTSIGRFLKNLRSSKERRNPPIAVQLIPPGHMPSDNLIGHKKLYPIEYANSASGSTMRSPFASPHQRDARKSIVEFSSNVMEEFKQEVDQLRSKSSAGLEEGTDNDKDVANSARGMPSLALSLGALSGKNNISESNNLLSSFPGEPLEVADSHQQTGSRGLRKASVMDSPRNMKVVSPRYDSPRIYEEEEAKRVQDRLFKLQTGLAGPVSAVARLLGVHVVARLVKWLRQARYEIKLQGAEKTYHKHLFQRVGKLFFNVGCAYNQGKRLFEKQLLRRTFREFVQVMALSRQRGYEAASKLLFVAESYRTKRVFIAWRRIAKASTVLKRDGIRASASFLSSESMSFDHEPRYRYWDGDVSCRNLVAMYWQDTIGKLLEKQRKREVFKRWSMYRSLGREKKDLKERAQSEAVKRQLTKVLASWKGAHAIVYLRKRHLLRLMSICFRALAHVAWEGKCAKIFRKGSKQRQEVMLKLEVIRKWQDRFRKSFLLTHKHLVKYIDNPSSAISSLFHTEEGTLRYNADESRAQDESRDSGPGRTTAVLGRQRSSSNLLHTTPQQPSAGMSPTVLLRPSFLSFVVHTFYSGYHSELHYFPSESARKKRDSQMNVTTSDLRIAWNRTRSTMFIAFWAWRRYCRWRAGLVANFSLTDEALERIENENDEVVHENEGGKEQESTVSPGMKELELEFARSGIHTKLTAERRPSAMQYWLVPTKTLPVDAVHTVSPFASDPSSSPTTRHQPSFAKLRQLPMSPAASEDGSRSSPVASPRQRLRKNSLSIMKRRSSFRASFQQSTQHEQTKELSVEGKVREAQQRQKEWAAITSPRISSMFNRDCVVLRKLEMRLIGAHYGQCVSSLLGPNMIQGTETNINISQLLGKKQRVSNKSSKKGTRGFMRVQSKTSKEKDLVSTRVASSDDELLPKVPVINEKPKVSSPSTPFTGISNNNNPQQGRPNKRGQQRSETPEIDTQLSLFLSAESFPGTPILSTSSSARKSLSPDNSRTRPPSASCGSRKQRVMEKCSRNVLHLHQENVEDNPLWIDDDSPLFTHPGAWVSQQGRNNNVLRSAAEDNTETNKTDVFERFAAVVKSALQETQKDDREDEDGVSFSFGWGVSRAIATSSPNEEPPGNRTDHDGIVEASGDSEKEEVSPSSDNGTASKSDDGHKPEEILLPLMDETAIATNVNDAAMAADCSSSTVSLEGETPKEEPLVIASTDRRHDSACRSQLIIDFRPEVQKKVVAEDKTAEDDEDEFLRQMLTCGNRGPDHADGAMVTYSWNPIEERRHRMSYFNNERLPHLEDTAHNEDIVRFPPGMDKDPSERPIDVHETSQRDSSKDVTGTDAGIGRGSHALDPVATAAAAGYSFTLYETHTRYGTGKRENSPSASANAGHRSHHAADAQQEVEAGQTSEDHNTEEEEEEEQKVPVHDHCVVYLPAAVPANPSRNIDAPSSSSTMVRKLRPSFPKRRAQNR